MIDLFLNPGRKDELNQLQQKVKEMETEATYTEVKTKSSKSPQTSLTSGCTVSHLSQSVPTSVALNAAMHIDRPCPHAPPVLVAGQVGQLLGHLHFCCHRLWNLLCLQCKRHPEGDQL